MSEKLIDRTQVQEMFPLTAKQFGRIMRNIERRHPLESWIKRIKENNKEKVYIQQECVEWLKEVYLNKEEHYLTLEIELPSIDEQKRIVSILDKFEKLCNDISQGLPAEIEARQKQYEYYRDKLLTFKELKVNE